MLLSEKGIFIMHCFFYRNFSEMSQLSFGMGRIYFYWQKQFEQSRSVYLWRQKKRQYVEFMQTVLPDSYVIDILGSFHGRMNDANTTKDTIDINNSIAT